MGVIVTLKVSETGKTIEFSFPEMSTTEQEWADMSEAERQELVEEVVNDMKDQPFWEISKFEIK